MKNDKLSVEAQYIQILAEENNTSMYCPICYRLKKRFGKILYDTCGDKECENKLKEKNQTMEHQTMEHQTMEHQTMEHQTMEHQTIRTEK